MKRLIKLFFLFCSFIVYSHAQNQINAVKVLGDVSKIGPLSRAWLSAEYRDIILYPNTSIYEDESKAKRVRVKALHNSESIAFLLEWQDETQNTSEECCPRSRKDGFALQFPQEFSDPKKLPYISMGNRTRSVELYVLEASESREESDVDNLYSQKLKEHYETFHTSFKKEKQYTKGFLAKGEKSLNPLSDTSSILMDIVYKNGKWKGSFTKILKDKNTNFNTGAFPVSFVVWDGSSNNKNGIEFLSPWIGVKLVEEKGGFELLNLLQETSSGDRENGKKLTIQNCAGCHNFKSSNIAPLYMAPNLSNIGGYSTLEYLKESIISPNAVVNEEYNANLQPDFPWYNVDASGNINSTMPSFEWMDEKSIEDIVTFLSSLKSEIE